MAPLAPAHARQKDIRYRGCEWCPDRANSDAVADTAQLEYKFKETLNEILETKEEGGECRKQVVERLTELSKYFTGEMALTRVEADENIRRTLQI